MVEYVTIRFRGLNPAIQSATLEGRLLFTTMHDDEAQGRSCRESGLA